MSSHFRLSIGDKPVEEHHHSDEQSIETQQFGDCHETVPERAVKDLAPTPGSSAEPADHLHCVPNELILHIIRSGLEEKFLNLLSGPYYGTNEHNLTLGPFDSRDPYDTPRFPFTIPMFQFITYYPRHASYHARVRQLVALSSSAARKVKSCLEQHHSALNHISLGDDKLYRQARNTYREMVNKLKYGLLPRTPENEDEVRQLLRHKIKAQRQEMSSFMAISVVRMCQDFVGAVLEGKVVKRQGQLWDFSMARTWFDDFA